VEDGRFIQEISNLILELVKINLQKMRKFKSPSQRSRWMSDKIFSCVYDMMQFSMISRLFFSYIK